MCLILAAWQVHPQYPLVIAANRDEFFARPTRPATFWDDAVDVLAGRDLQAGGTWLGVTRAGRFAALTNYRDPSQENPAAISRGGLVSSFLQGDVSVTDYLASIARIDTQYNGFNLLVCDGKSMACYNNIGHSMRVLEPGVHGLSNHVINSPWPKVTAASKALKTSLDGLPDTGPLFNFLRDDSTADDADLPNTGIALERERALSAIFVRNIAELAYGTRSSAVLVMGADKRVTFDEQEWNADASLVHRQRFKFMLN